LEPIAKPSVSSAVTVKPGALRYVRHAYRASCPNSCIQRSPFISVSKGSADISSNGLNMDHRFQRASRQQAKLLAAAVMLMGSGGLCNGLAAPVRTTAST
jgi:hypothetical protein